MKQFFTLCLIALTAVLSNAQTSNAVVFSENGDKFTLILNGEKQNATPQTNVKVSNLTSEFYLARIDFEDAKLPDFNHNNFAVQKGMETTYVIRVNKKGEYVLRFMTSTDIEGTPSSAQEEAPSKPVIKDYSGTAEPSSSPNTVTTTTTAKPASSTTTTTTVVTKPTDSEKVNVNMNVGGLNVGFNMNIEGEGAETMEVKETTTVTSTSTSSSSSSSSNARPRQEVVVQEKTVAGCARAMDAATFNSAKGSISSKGFDETKLSTAKQVAKSNCMNVNQIKEVMNLFGFEESKLDFAKFAYDYCVDKNNYFMVNDAFSFESSIDELNQHIESK